MQIAKRPSGDSRWQWPPALAGLWGNTEEPDKPSESFQGDAAAEDEPQGEQYLQTNYSIRQFLWEDALKKWFHGIGKNKMVVRNIMLVVRGVEMWPR